ncbi:DUF3892 domain-containing protein [Corallococcus interemptor]|uniref:hypothetical protein n=1 Tax=Corallococcus TaxID=83461 RepID=UPI0035D4919A
MSTKWADLIISAVRYDPTGTYITHYLVHEDDGTKFLPPGKPWSVHDVALAIIQGRKVITTVKADDGWWYPGAPVDISLRTRQDKSKADNLENLPPF